MSRRRGHVLAATERILPVRNLRCHRTAGSDRAVPGEPQGRTADATAPLRAGMAAMRLGGGDDYRVPTATCLLHSTYPNALHVRLITRRVVTMPHSSAPLPPSGSTPNRSSIHSREMSVTIIRTAARTASTV